MYKHIYIYIYIYIYIRISLRQACGGGLSLRFLDVCTSTGLHPSLLVLEAAQVTTIESEPDLEVPHIFMY